MEDVIGLLEDARGHTHDVVYDLLFTKDRVIALIVEHPSDVPYRFSVTDFLIGNQLGKQSDRFAKKRIVEERRRNYRQTANDKLVEANDRNFDVLYTAVTSS